MSSKILSIIMPTYNREKLFIKTVLNFQKYKKFINIIIIEDGSDVNTVKKNRSAIKKFKNIKYFLLKKNSGQSYACNFGLKNCFTDYVWFFDDDDYVSKKSLKYILYNIRKNKNHSYLLPMSKVYNDIILEKIDPSIRKHDFDDLRNNGQLVNTSCAIFKTSHIKKIKGWDENLYGGTDTDLFLRFSKYNNFAFLNTDPVQVNISVGNRLTNKLFRQQTAKIYFLKKHWGILTIKRKFYYILNLFLLAPLIYSFKDRLILLSIKIRNIINSYVQK
jgi:glycosyltransferase involved in cell wall biosynthesis